MDFNKEKKEFLSKKDKSRKGSIDLKIKKLVYRINSLEDFFTTSSCAGRVLIHTAPKSNKKNMVRYLYCSHNKVRENFAREILSSLSSANHKDDIWIRVDGAILHIACKKLETATKILNTARDIGFKRSGIISLGKNRVTVELISTERIETIISKEGKIVIDEDYLNTLFIEGNYKLENSWKKINKLENKIEILFS
jgi:tRNA wybutosine-synthesizing protein 3